MAYKRMKELRKRLTSLSALGAGVLAAGAATATAEVIDAHGPNATISHSGLPSYAVAGLPGGAGFGFKNFSSSAVLPNGVLQTVVNQGHQSVYGNGVAFAQAGGLVRLFDLGQTMGAASVGSNLLVGGLKHSSKVSFVPRVSTVPYSHTVLVKNVLSTHAAQLGNAPFTDKFALFRFNSPGGTLFGWAELSYTLTQSRPQLQLIDWAYDASGNPIAAGQTNTPEPDTLVSTGLAALVLGAAGLRPWRKAKARG